MPGRQGDPDKIFQGAVLEPLPSIIHVFASRAFLGKAVRSGHGEIQRHHRVLGVSEKQNLFVTRKIELRAEKEETSEAQIGKAPRIQDPLNIPVDLYHRSAFGKSVARNIDYRQVFQSADVLHDIVQKRAATLGSRKYKE